MALRRAYEIPGIEHGSIACKENSLPVVLSLQSEKKDIKKLATKNDEDSEQFTVRMIVGTDNSGQ